MLLEAADNHIICHQFIVSATNSSFSMVEIAASEVKNKGNRREVQRKTRKEQEQDVQRGTSREGRRQGREPEGEKGRKTRNEGRHKVIHVGEKEVMAAKHDCHGDEAKRWRQTKRRGKEGNE